MNGQKIMERSTIEEVVLEQIYALAGINPPVQKQDNASSGYPLPVRPKWANWIFYGFCPLLTLLAWWLTRRLEGVKE
jgi:hypothetical protein